MKHLFHRLYLFSCNFIHILSLAFTGLLFLSSFLFTCYADDMVSQQVQTAVDNPFGNLLGILLFAGILFLCCRLVCRKPAKGKRILLTMVMGWIVLLGMFLILFGRTAPAADAWSVYSAADSLASGNLSVIHPTESYLSYYPQQIGLVAFFEILIRLWRLLPTDLQAYHFIKCLYVLLTCVIVYYQYAAVHLLWADDRADCIYLILAGTNLPMIMYSSFVYGEIPSFAAMSVGLYYLLKMLKRQGTESNVKTGFRHGFISLIALTLAVMLRKNSLILIIAVVLVVMMEWLSSRCHTLFLYTALCLVCSLSILPVTQTFYEYRSESSLRTGVPAMSYFAMGMQESSRGNGWYNGFNFNTYQDSGMDTDTTVELSRQFISDRITYFQEHPGYAAGFYFNKFLSQWTDGTYASRQATLATFGGRHPLVEYWYTGAGSNLYIGYCNIYQNIIYLGCLAGTLAALLKRRKYPLYVWIGMIGAFGGFLFHMIWEANARYIFLYSLCLLPYAANGLAEINNTFFLGKNCQNTKGHTEDATKTPSTAA